MNSQRKYFENKEWEMEELKITPNVQKVVDLYEYLSPEEKVQVKKIIKQLNIY